MVDIAVYNNSGAAILQGQVVRQTGFVQPQQLPSIALASAAATSTATVLGIATEIIANNSSGQVRVSGSYGPLDTSSFILGSKVFLSDTPGEISPTPGTVESTIGNVEVAAVAGCIYITCIAPVTSCSTGSGGDGDQGVTGIQGATGVGAGGGGGGATGLQGATGIQGDTGIGIQGATGLNTVTYLELSNNQAVPTNGTRYLRIGRVFTSTVGYHTFEATTLTALSIRVNTTDGTRDYDLEILSPSSSGPTVIATLALPSGSISATSTLSVAIPSGSEVGARLVRTSGTGASSFNNYVALLKLE